MGEATRQDLLEGPELSQRLAKSSDWRQVEEQSAIRRRLVFADFRSAFSFMTEVAEKAEELNHHPEWCNVWNRVDIVLTTHSAGGLTERDFTLAREIDRISSKFPLVCAADDGEACGGCV